MNAKVMAPIYLPNASFVFPQMYNFTEDYYRELKKILRIKRVKDFPFVRLGKQNDGGYLMVENFCTTGGGIAYSFGISNDVSWDLDMVNRGYDIFQYDMTINQLPVENEHFHFFKEGIGGIKDVEKSLDTLENFIKRNGHTENKNMILKMDVEGAEWDFLYTMPKNFLSCFNQMVFEFHNLIQPKNLFNMAVTLELLRKISDTHTLVHLHGNNFGSYLQIENVGTFPDTLELTYLKTDDYLFEDDENIFLPIELDQPNQPAFPEIQLGYWNKFTD